MAENSTHLQRSPGLTTRVTQHLLDSIDAGTIRPGDRLVETDLASKLGVSRAPLREAFRELSSYGLVEHRDGRGAYVISPSDDSMQQMGVFRGLLEGDAASLLTSRRNTAGLAQVTREMEEAEARGDARQFAQLHWLFHRSICTGAGNSFLLDAWDRVSRQIRIYLNMHLPKLEHAQVLRNNRAVLRTVSEREPDEAAALVRSLIIRATFNALQRPTPIELAHLVRVSVDDDGEVCTN